MNITPYVVKQLLKKHGFVERKMQKAVTMKACKDRNEQFENSRADKRILKEQESDYQYRCQKKEFIGNFYREGKVYCTQPLKVYDHDFNTFSDGVVIPHGIYDLKRNEGYITLGTSKDTSEFCCDCIKDWWKKYGKENDPGSNSVLTLADGGGSNSSRHYIFKEDLQKLVDEIGIEIRMAHYPSYASKYNPIEHRLFCHITSACKGAVFSSIDVVKSLVDKTSTSTGLKVFSTIKDKVYAKARKVSETFKENMKIVFDDYLGKWNYKVIPNVKTLSYFLAIPKS